MLVTIFTDASYDHRSKSGGWACWIKSQRGKIEHGGAIKHPIGTSDQAEMCAIVNAIVVAKKSAVAQPGDKLLIQSDCISAMVTLERRIAGKRRYRKVRQPILDAYSIESQGFEIIFRHVRAHTGGSDVRSFVNKVCDKTSRRHQRGLKNAKKQKKATEAADGKESNT